MRNLWYMTGFERFNEGAKKAAERAKKLPIMNPSALKEIVLADAPSALNTKRPKADKI
jgi:hypothetical protein